MPNEKHTYPDPTTGCVVTRWTDHTSNHPYFTNPGWFDGGKQLLVISDQSGRPELVAVDLATGDQRPVTDASQSQPLQDAFQVAVDDERNRAVTWRGLALVLIDLMTGEERVLWEREPSDRGVIPNFTADGACVCFGVTEDLPDTPGFDDRFAAKPRSAVMCVDVDGSNARVVHERDVWMGHVNTSPANPDFISFCHEGPWTKVEHRVWCCDLRDGRTWRVAEVGDAPACVGHEYWLADGRRIAYHGYNARAQPTLGVADVHTGQRIEHVQPVKTKHSHSLDGRLIVGDGSESEPWILAWLLEDDELRGPWRICRHGGGWSEQRRHVHPRISPDGKHVVYTSDAGGQPRVYSVELPADVTTCPAV